MYKEARWKSYSSDLFLSEQSGRKRNATKNPQTMTMSTAGKRSDWWVQGRERERERDSVVRNSVSSCATRPSSSVWHVLVHDGDLQLRRALISHRNV